MSYTTHIVCILDCSGSMEPLTDDTIGGYNRFLSEQQSMQLPQDTWTLVLFNDISRTVLRRVPLDRVPRLSPETYRPGASTALLDALGEAMAALPVVPEPTERIVCLVQTDGAENASSVFSLERVREMVAERESGGAWTFVFMGAGLDAFAQLRTVSATAQPANALSYARSETRAAWATTSSATEAFRSGKSRSRADYYRRVNQQEQPGP